MHGVLFYFDPVVLSSGGRCGRLGSCGERPIREPEEAHSPYTPQHLQLVRQEMAVCPEQLSEFLNSLRQYLRGTAGARSCFQ